jgi:hypothetical protein
MSAIILLRRQVGDMLATLPNFLILSHMKRHVQQCDENVVARYAYLASSPSGIRELSRILYLSIKISRISRSAKLLVSVARPIILGQVSHSMSRMVKNMLVAANDFAHIYFC